MRRTVFSRDNSVLPLRDNFVLLPRMAVGILAAVLLLTAGSPPLQAQDYTPLAGLRVSNGRVQYSFFSAGGCINLSNTSINGVVLTVHSSKWQRKTGSTWTDIPDTERTGGLCAYSTMVPGEYRLIGDVTIDGERGSYRSENTFIVEGSAVTAPDAPGNLTAAARGWAGDVDLDSPDQRRRRRDQRL